MSTLKSARATAERIKQRIRSLVRESEIPENAGRIGDADKLCRYLEHYKAAREEVKTLSIAPADITDFENEVDTEVDFCLDTEDRAFVLRALESNAKPNPEAGTASTSGSGMMRAKLPKLELESFSGDVLCFTAYWASFSNNVDTREDLSVDDKFAYLAMSLKGSAGTCIAGLERNEKNYERAKKRILERYGDKQARVSAHFRALHEIKLAGGGTASLRSVYDSVETHLGNLEALGEVMNDKSILEILRSKFPANVLIALEDTVQEGESMTIDLFRSKLHRYITVRERCEGSLQGEIKSNVKPRGQVSFNRSISQPNTPYKGTSTGAFVAGAGTPGSSTKRLPPGGCIYCSGPHWNDDCDTYLTVASRKARIRGRCFNCFSSQHQKDACNNVRACRHCGGMDHHRSLCDKFVSERATVAVAGVQGLESTESGNDLITLVAIASSSSETFLPATSVLISNPTSDARITTKLLMDTGAQATFVSQALVTQLGLKSQGKVKINLYRFGTTEAVPATCGKVGLKLFFRGGWVEVSAIVVPFITNQFFSASYFAELQAARRLYPNLPISGASRDGEVGVLVGSDLYYYFVGPRLLSIRPGLFLTETRFGFLLVGRERDSDCIRPSVVSLTVGLEPGGSTARKIEFDLKRFWELDVIGIGDELDVEDDRAVCRFGETVVFEGGRYWVSWPWRRFPPDLPDNFGLALGRLRSLITRLRAEGRMEEYDQTIRAQVEAGVVEELDSRHNGLEHYLPHKHVVKEGKTTKLRVVFDASSKCRRGVNSLNDCLFRGRVILEDQVKVLLRFRRHEIAVTADVEKAFLQLGLRTEDDCNVVRFLWVKNVSGGIEGTNLQLLRFRRVVFGVSSSPFLLNAVIRNHINGSLGRYPELSSLLSGLYVDNLALSLPNREEMLKLYYSSRKVFSAASMNLREWYTHDQELKHRARMSGDYVFKEDDLVGMLGYEWSCAGDELRMSVVREWSGSEKCTKRAVASYVSSIYDPIGFVGPVSMAGKLILRKLWNAGVDWDEPVDADLIAEWVQISRLIFLAIAQFRVPRWSVYLCEGTNELHCFVDASQNVYAACLYVRSSSNDFDFQSNLILSKNRLAPLNKAKKLALSIPRMELMAATIGSRLIKLARDEFPLTRRTVLWSDSQCVLRWLSSTKLLPLFEENRVRQIKSVPKVEFRYVPTKENPADLLTRIPQEPGCVTSDHWLQGPEFLKHESELWPEWEATSEAPSEAEVWGVNVATALVRLEACERANPPYGMNVERYRSLGQLLRVTALCNRFVGTKPNVCAVNVVQPCEMELALLMWVEYVQYDAYPEHFLATRVKHNPLRMVIDSTRTNVCGNEVELAPSPATRLWLRFSKLRLSTRLAKSALDFSEKNPVVLPDKHPFTRLLIKSVHFEAYHAGVLNTLARIRREFFIVRGRNAVRQMVSKCNVCVWMLSGPYRMPDFPALPSYRVNKSHPFAHCGLDGLGPFHIRTMQGPAKIYVLQITCLVTRAVYLCPLEDLSGESFLCRLREFGGRYCLPSIILCDNARAFKTVSVVSQKVWLSMVRSEEVQRFGGQDGRKIEWKFIPALAPWTGGVYERLNAMIKRCFYFTFGEAKLTRLQFDAVIGEIQGILNSRPLCEINEYEGYLTPNHFLQVPILTRGPVVEKGRLQSDVQNDILKIWRRGCRVLDQFWHHWRELYLRALAGSRKWKIKQGRVVSSATPKIGEPVLIGEQLPRHYWRVGRICELFRGEDGFVRSCLVRTLDGRELHRSVSQLYPYESHLEEVQQSGIVLSKASIDLSNNVTGDPEGTGSLSSEETMVPRRDSLAERRGCSVGPIDLSNLSAGDEEFGTPMAKVEGVGVREAWKAGEAGTPRGRLVPMTPRSDLGNPGTSAEFGDEGSPTTPRNVYEPLSPITPCNRGPPPSPITPALMKESGSRGEVPRVAGPGMMIVPPGVVTASDSREMRAAALEARQRLFNLIPARAKLGPTRPPKGGECHRIDE